MKISFIHIIIAHVLIITSTFAQSKQSASADIRIKIVKNITVEVSEFSSDMHSISKNLTIPNISSVAKRDLMIQYANRLNKDSKLVKRGTETKKSQILQIGIENVENMRFLQIDSQKEFSLKTSLKTDKIKFLYKNLTIEHAYNYKPSITIIY